MPIGVIVAVAIACIVVAVLSSAQHADQMALQHEKQMFGRALTLYGERVLREVRGVATAPSAMQIIRQNFNPEWVKQRVDQWLETYFDHDYVAVFDGRDNLIYSQTSRRSTDARGLAAARSELASFLGYIRAREPALHGAVYLGESNPTGAHPHPKIAVVRNILGRPAIVAAVAVGPMDNVPGVGDGSAPVMISVKLIDANVLGDIAGQLRLANLRQLRAEIPSADDAIYELTGPQGEIFARFAWTPKQPGRDRAQRHSLHRRRLCRLRAARRLRAALHAPHRRRDCRR